MKDNRQDFINELSDLMDKHRVILDCNGENGIEFNFPFLEKCVELLPYGTYTPQKLIDEQGVFLNPE